MTLSLALTGNEPRQRYLFETLESLAHVAALVSFDDIDPLTRYLAAALSFAWPRSEWWENYHMHPLVQRRRRHVLARELSHVPERIDALLMWGSWFQPFRDTSPRVPTFHYIDQSRSLHNLPGERVGRFSRRKRSHELQAKTYEAAARVFCMSEWAREQTLESHKLDPLKVTAVGWGPCAVDLSGEDLEHTARKPLVLHISNDFHRKGIDFLLATAERVCTAVPDAHFVVIGRDARGANPPQSSRRVSFLGRISDRQVLSSYFRQASVFFLPHRFDRSPHVLVEAMSAALPLVASEQGGAIELIRDQGTGFLRRAGDVPGYADAIIEILRDHDLRRTLGRRAQTLVRTRYNWPAISKQIVSEISALVGVT